MKTHYTAAELAAMKLPSLPTSKMGMTLRAAAENWPYQEQTGMGGLSRYFAVPSYVVDLIAQRNAVAVAASKAIVPTAAQLKLPTLTTDQNQLVADARAGIVQQIELMQARAGYSLEKSCAVLLDMARTGQAAPQLVAMLRHARDTRGKKSVHDDGLPSARSLRRFVERRETNTLCPAYREADRIIPAWGTAFLAEYQTPQKPTVAAAYTRFKAQWDSHPLPSIHAVRRWLDKLGTVTRQAGRMGSRTLKNLQGYVKRDFSDLLPGDIYTADGHQFDAQVQHPLHGQAWRPEITSVVDVATRRCVGFSVALAESGLAVLDALRAAVLTGGVPAILYVDNGSGYVNGMMSDEAVGLMGRLGIQMHHSIPYNSQARGVIERLHQTIWVTAAKSFDSYLGADMDAQARQAMFKITRSHLKQHAVLTKNPLMPFFDFVDFCQREVAAYNDRPHRSLPRIIDPLTGKRRHQTPTEAWEEKVASGWTPTVVTDTEAETLFRPRTLCAIRRCWIRLFGNDYYSRELEEWHGDTLPVGYDIHHPEKVWVYDDQGRLICTAGLDQNKRPYMPKSVVERAREQRGDARERRVLNQLDEIHAERNTRPVITHQPDVSLPGLFGDSLSRSRLAERAAVLRAHDAEPIPIAAKPAPTTHTEEAAWAVPPTLADRRAEWTRLDSLSPAQRADLGDRAVRWHAMYPASAEHRAGIRKTA